jgi:hypothetical protein
VKALVAETNPKIEALETDLVAQQFGKEAKNKMEWLTTLKNVATQCMEKDVWDQALDKLEAALQVIYEITQV